MAKYYILVLYTLLASLSIQNYALIDDLQVDFSDDFTIITGETGSGKSIILDALSLVLGNRADLSSVKNTSQKCVIEAVFNITSYGLANLFESIVVDYDDETILRREILPSGKSRAFINDSPVTLSILSTLSGKLVDIHSQHHNLDIASNNFQFKVLDALANNYDLRQSYANTLNAYKNLKQEIEKLKIRKAESIREQDYNTFLFNELEKAKLNELNLETLELEQETLSNVADIRDELQIAYQILNDDSIGILQSLNDLKNRIGKLSRLSSAYESVHKRIESLSIELEDIYSEVEHSKDNLEANPNRLSELNEQLSLIQNLLLKHSVNSIDDLLTIKNDLSDKVNLFETIDDQILELENKFIKLENKLDNNARHIHESRVKIIPKLKDELQKSLVRLGMPHARFTIDLNKSKTFYENGYDTLSFLFTANKGSNPKDLKLVASGGELSRIMLALKSVLAKNSNLPTLIFDEIDTGVSGEVSNNIAHIMKEMSASMQIFAITHLPQIAAQGNHHFKVYKETTNHTTFTRLKKLTAEERINEIAEMLGGKQISDSAIEHAKQLLN